MTSLQTSTRRSLTTIQKTSMSRSTLRVLAGERDGRQFIAACRNKTEFCRRAGVHHLAYDGECSDPTGRALALGNPDGVFSRPARTSEPYRTEVVS